MSDISVVIPARNAATTIGEQLRALANQDFEHPWELVVVDSASHDHTGSVVDSWSRSLPQLRRITADQPGANRARNLGIAAARGDLILLCDADDVVSASWISSMSARLQRFDVVGGTMEYAQLNRAAVPGSPWPVKTQMLPTLFGRPYAISANMSFHRSVSDELHGFDETFGVGADDIDFSWRAMDAGFSLGFSPDSVVHYRLRTSRRAWLRQQYSYAQGEAHLYAKHMELGRLPRRSGRQQARTLGGHIYKILACFPHAMEPVRRDELLKRSALLAGGLAGARRHGVFI